MKVQAIINPSSGRERIQKDLPAMLHMLNIENIISDLEVKFTQGADDAFNFAKLADDCDILLAAGGDGTANEVINGIMHGNTNTKLALMAAGTVNDFAYTMRLPKTVEDMRLLLCQHKVQKVDVGKVNDKYFLNVCAGGALTDVAYTTSRELKTLFGRFAYILNGIVTAPVSLLNPGKYKITLPDEVIEDDLLLFLVGNSQSIGGFRQIMPKGSATDGLLDILALRAGIRNPAEIGEWISLHYQIQNGIHLNSPILYYRQAPWIEVQEITGKKVVLDYDGEAGDVLPAKIEVIPKAINLLVPK